MKLLLDTGAGLGPCVWGKASDELSTVGHDVICSGAWPQDPGDEEILAFAHREGRVLVTLDKDFGELAIVRGSAHSGILRLVNISAKHHASVCLRVIASHGKELEASAIITAEPGRLRVRPAAVAE